MPIASAFVRLLAVQTALPLDELIARLASEQYGVVARRQLIALGASRDEIQSRIERGQLRPLHRGTYAVGHTALTRRSRWMAAVLAAGPGAVLSHRSAGAFYEICREGRKIEITVPKHRKPHRCIQLAPDEHETRDNIPITTPARTLFDLAAVLPPER